MRDGQVAAGPPLPAIIDAWKLGRPVVDHVEAHASGGRIDPRSGETALDGRQSGDTEIEMVPPGENGDDFAAFLPRVGVVPAPEGIGLDPADLAVLTVARNYGDAGPPIW